MNPHHADPSPLADTKCGPTVPISSAKRDFFRTSSVRTESISKTMERRSSENVDAAIFEYRVRGDNRPLHSSYVKKK